MLAPSAFVVRAFKRAQLSVPSRVLDLPAGTGRHAAWAALQGHSTTVADIDPSLVSGTVAMVRAMGLRCDGVVLDATRTLPFRDGSFDAVLIVDFVHEDLFRRIGRVIRSGGIIIHQSYADRGQNWRQLLNPGATVAALASDFIFVESDTRAVGPTVNKGETIALLARRP